MNALQAQVDPHFLHNTLTVIAAYGRSSGNQKVAEMCIALSDMLRYTMKFDRKDSTIGAEIENVERYLTLMKSKYDGYLNIEMSIDPSMFPIPIPRLTLQPIVENAFHHGFSGIEPPWELRIIGSVSGDSWKITITDNGVGLTQILIDKINLQLEKIKHDPGLEAESLAELDGESGTVLVRNSNGIGITNVIARLVLFYGPTVEFRLENAVSGGTECTIAGRR